MSTPQKTLGGSLNELFFEHEDVHFYDNPELGFSAVIAIHDTTLGPALGGCRRMAYPSLWSACVDVARLSKGMTYKAALIDFVHGGIPLGGGKCVMIPHKSAKRMRGRQFRALGAFIDTLGGKYISAEDVGTSVNDIKVMARETKYVCGKMIDHPHHGDPSPYTALGVYYGMLGSLRALHGNGVTFEGRSVYVEGLGKVGLRLAEFLYEAGAVLYVSNRTKTEVERTALLRAQDEFGAIRVPLNSLDIPEVFPCVEIYAPCALGGVVSSERIYQYPFGLQLIAGAANNVLLDPVKDGKYLRKRNIAYAPDYVINNRGLWDVYNQVRAERGETPYLEETVLAGCRDNESLLHEIVSRALSEEKCPHAVADQMAQSVLDRKKFELLT